MTEVLQLPSTSTTTNTIATTTATNKTDESSFQHHLSPPPYLPPYRSLLTPHIKYDYQLHRTIELSKDEQLNHANGYYYDPYFHLFNSQQQQRPPMSSSLPPDNNKKQKIKMKYKSLLTDTKKKLFNSDLFSLASITTTTTTTTTTAKANNNASIPKATIQSLPQEIVESILWHLQDDQHILVNCLYVNKSFYKASLPALYYKPYFTSTYRVGQFITSLQENPSLAQHVKCLDLSQLEPSSGFDDLGNTSDNDDDIDIFQLVFNTAPENLDELLSSDFNKDHQLDHHHHNHHHPRAGWRDWKFRDNPLYGRRPPPYSSVSQQLSPQLQQQPALFRQQTNTTLVSNNTSTTGGSSFRYHHKQRANSDTTLARPTSEFYEMYRNFDILLPSNSHSSSSSSSLAVRRFNIKRSSKYKKFKYAFLNKKKGRKHQLHNKQQQQQHHQLGRKTNIEQEQEARLKSNVTFDLKQAERKPYYEPFTELHPLTNKFLSKYSVTKDLPIGYIIHLLSMCTNLIDLNMSNLSLSLDFRIIPNDVEISYNTQLQFENLQEEEGNTQKNGSGHGCGNGGYYNIQSLIPSTDHEENSDDSAQKFAPHYKTKKLKQFSKYELSTKLIFLSDLGVNTVDQVSSSSSILKKNRNRRDHTRSIKLTPGDIIEQLSNLQNLQNLNLRNCVWLDKRLVLKFIQLYHKTHKHLTIDLVDSGMIKNSNWSITGDMTSLIDVFKNEERLLRNWENMYSLIHRIGENY